MGRHKLSYRISIFTVSPNSASLSAVSPSALVAPSMRLPPEKIRYSDEFSFTSLSTWKRDVYETIPELIPDNSEQCENDRDVGWRSEQACRQIG
ncbi:hypothetical protein RR42_s1306 [Cupriavidus basilensis]|uniref:Uncharacterized protein n=1 Tax=Cupriavidus basilensis TaxID=68895 RepID=A0A0C4YLJ5_9BURK|nr:hypothetical protein RR42_s1306 [Cupriavidus basilensis]